MLCVHLNDARMDVKCWVFPPNQLKIHTTAGTLAVAFLRQGKPRNLSLGIWGPCALTVFLPHAPVQVLHILAISLRKDRPKDQFCWYLDGNITCRLQGVGLPRSRPSAKLETDALALL